MLSLRVVEEQPIRPFLSLNVLPTAPIKLPTIRKYTYPIVLQRGKLVHGDKFDYGLVKPEDVKGYNSNIEIICKVCGHQWITSIASHINQRCGCPSCSGVIRWTYERFIKRAYEIHGDTIDYGLIRPDHIQGAKSLVPVKCNICEYSWNVSITHHITSKTGCPSCFGNARWTLERVLRRVTEIYGDKNDYTLITPEMVQTQQSHIPIICNTCRCQWSPSINNHINNKTGCPSCYGNIPFTLDSFIQRSQDIHEDKIDYSHVKPEHIQGNKSHVPLTCKICDYSWNPTIDCHINGKAGCPDCAGKAPWTLERLHKKAHEVHNDRHDYSQVTNEHIKGWTSRIPVRCNKCNNNWTPLLYNHITGRQGCPRCRKSHGEIACERSLQSLGIDYMCEFILPNLPRKRFDFRFEYNGKKYLLEFDGVQHFEFSPRFHYDQQAFIEKQSVDTLKTQKGIEEGYYIIRIDHTQIDNIDQHIREAIKTSVNADNTEYFLDPVAYFSNPLMYKYIMDTTVY